MLQIIVAMAIRTLPRMIDSILTRTFAQAMLEASENRQVHACFKKSQMNEMTAH